MSNRTDARWPTPPPPGALRVAADLGNSRLKWGRLGADGRVAEVVALPPDDPARWVAAWRDWDRDGSASSSWAVSSVNPPAAEALAQFLDEKPGRVVVWYRSAADVALAHELERPETTGADRALAVLAAKTLRPRGAPGLVVLCGTAITVERVAADGTWQGGAIAPGLGLSARALHMLTAQLPLIVPEVDPPAWGRETLPAIRAGVYWGVVGAIRELLTRQAAKLGGRPWVVFSGGDSEALCASVGTGAEVIPDLVLQGLAITAFGAESSGMGPGQDGSHGRE